MQPVQVQKQKQALVELIDKDDKPYILANDLAKFMGIDQECLRMLAEQGKLPFGVAGKENELANRIFRFPKLAVWNWFQGQYQRGEQ